MGTGRIVLLEDAINDFLRFRSSMDLSKNTIKQDASTLRQFMGVTGNIYVHSIADHHITLFFEKGARTRQPQSLRNDHTRLDVFFAWARKTGRMGRDNDPLYGRRKPRQVKRERQRIHVSKFPALLDMAEIREPRDRIALALLLYTLGRDGEITSLRIRDVDLAGGHIRMMIHKTRQEDMLPICAELDAELRKWLTHYAETVGFLEPGYFLVPSRQTGPVYRDGRIVGAYTQSYVPTTAVGELAKIVKPAMRDIGFDTSDREGAHTIRRSGARALFERLLAEGVDYSLEIVQSMLHHASRSQTETYIGYEPSRHKRDDLIRGKSLYGVTGNVTQLRSVSDGSTNH